jgi:hypothetical protein
LPSVFGIGHGAADGAMHLIAAVSGGQIGLVG